MFRFVPNSLPHDFFVIGCGGTGSRLVPMLTQFIRTLTHGISPRGWLMKPRIFLIDDDVLEEKNLLRQNFARSDVGNHKASALANRYGKAYEMEVYPILDKITTFENLMKSMEEVQFFEPPTGDINLINGSKSVGISRIRDAMVIMCVDSMEARRNIIKTFSEFQNLKNYANRNEDMTRNPLKHASKVLFIDSGNEDSFGQVSFFNAVSMSKTSVEYAKNILTSIGPHVLDTVDMNYMPIDSHHYMSTPDMKGQGSCADLDQTLAINAIMATSIMGIVQNYMYHKPMVYNKVTTDLNGGSYVTFNNLPYFNSRFLNQFEAQVEASKSLIHSFNDSAYDARYIPVASLDVLYQSLLQVKKKRETEERAAAKEAKLAEQAEVKEGKHTKKKKPSVSEVSSEPLVAVHTPPVESSTATIIVPDIPF